MDRTLYSLNILQLAIDRLQASVDPIVLGLLLVGVITSLVQGAFQVDDMALGFVAKILAIGFAASAMIVCFDQIAGLAHDWISHIPSMIDQTWS